MVAPVRGRGDGQARHGPEVDGPQVVPPGDGPVPVHAEQGAGVAVVGEEQAAPGPPRQPDQVVPGQAAEGGPHDRAARLPVDQGRALEEDEGAPRVVGGAADVLRGQVGRRPQPCRPVSAQRLAGVRDDVTPGEYGRRTGAGVDAERAPHRRPGEQRGAVVPTVRRQPQHPLPARDEQGVQPRGSTRCPWDARRRARRSAVSRTWWRRLVAFTPGTEGADAATVEAVEAVAGRRDGREEGCGQHECDKPAVYPHPGLPHLLGCPRNGSSLRAGWHPPKCVPPVPGLVRGGPAHPY